ncbi:MAG: diguanylate cyclase [Deltaproteobacteria bacterium]|nr:diguanylate cyclase [Deltaproteobacteria bacterium]
MALVETDLLGVIAAGTGCGLVLLDKDDRVLYWSPQMAEISGISAAQIVGQSWSNLVLPSGFTGAEGAGNPVFAPAATVLSGIVFYPVTAGQGVAGRRLGVLRMTSQLEGKSDEFPFVNENAQGIPNQHALFELLQHQLAYHKRYRTPFSLLFLRMKNFHTFVEVLGVDNWEITSRAVYDQLSAIVRMADSVGLYDRATFWMVLANSDLEGTRVVAEKVKRLASSMKVEAIDVFLAVAVGAVLARDDERSDDLVRRGLAEVEEALKAVVGISVAG